MITSRGYFTGFMTSLVRRDQLEYPTVNVSFAYLAAIGKLKLDGFRGLAGAVTVDSFTDRRVWTLGRVGAAGHEGIILGRLVDGRNHYHTAWGGGWVTADHKIRKLANDTLYDLATEAVDLSGSNVYHAAFQASGTTLKSWRTDGPPDWASPTLTATDTTFSSGGFGVCFGGDLINALLLEPASATPRPIAYFEVPVVGSGTYEDPFRPQLPEDIRDGVNVLALTHSALIKSGKDGKPMEYRAILRIFPQPDRPANLAPIGQALEALTSMPDVKRLSREEAIKEAKKLDDKLHDLDLLSSRELRLDRKQAGKEYMSWRVHNLGVREELLDLEIQERYAEEDKGW